MKSFMIFRLLLVFVTLGFGTVAVHAQNLDAVKARIEQRIGPINAMKGRGVVGETNRGYLEARGGATGADQQVIAAENADRQTVYAALGAKAGANAEAVGRQRAQQIAANAQRGHWIQGPNGAWAQKG